MPTKPKKLHGSLPGIQRTTRGRRSERGNDQRIREAVSESSDMSGHGSGRDCLAREDAGSRYGLGTELRHLQKCSLSCPLTSSRTPPLSSSPRATIPVSAQGRASLRSQQTRSRSNQAAGYFLLVEHCATSKRSCDDRLQRGLTSLSIFLEISQTIAFSLAALLNNIDSRIAVSHPAFTHSSPVLPKVRRCAVIAVLLLLRALHVSPRKPCNHPLAAD